MNEPAFSARLTKRLHSFKYGYWAAREHSVLPLKQLRSLIWLVGEFDTSASEIIKSLHNHKPEIERCERGYLALQALHCMVRGESYIRFGWTEEMELTRTIMEITDLPEPVRSVLFNKAPGVEWKSIRVDRNGFAAESDGPLSEKKYVTVSIKGEIQYLGSDRRMKPRSPTAFSDDFKQVLKSGKYTQWAADRNFTEKNMYVFISMIAEFGYRSGGLLEVLNRDEEASIEHSRAIASLELIGEMEHGPKDVDETLRQIECKRRIRLEFMDLPESLQSALRWAAPRAIWDLVSKKENNYDLFGHSSTGQSAKAQITSAGEITIRICIEHDELPRKILDDIKKRLPGAKYLNVVSEGSGQESIQHYELKIQPYFGDIRKFVFQPDGLDVSPDRDFESKFNPEGLIETILWPLRLGILRFKYRITSGFRIKIMQLKNRVYRYWKVFRFRYRRFLK